MSILVFKGFADCNALCLCHSKANNSNKMTQQYAESFYLQTFTKK